MRRFCIGSTVRGYLARNVIKVRVDDLAHLSARFK